MKIKKIPFYGSEDTQLFEIERRCMDKDGVVLAYLNQVLPLDYVLDIGAGNGFTANTLSVKNRFVVPCEPSIPMVDKAKQLSWTIGLAQELPFQSNSFSAAYATWAYFFPTYHSIENGLNETNRVVKSGRDIIIVDNAGGDEFCGLFQRDISSDSSWWQNKGFECRILHSTFKFDSIEEAKKLLSYYWKANGRGAGAEAKTEIEYKIAVYTAPAK